MSALDFHVENRSLTFTLKLLACDFPVKKYQERSVQDEVWRGGSNHLNQQVLQQIPNRAHNQETAYSRQHFCSPSKHSFMNAISGTEILPESSLQFHVQDNLVSIEKALRQLLVVCECPLCWSVRVRKHTVRHRSTTCVSFQVLHICAISEEDHVWKPIFGRLENPSEKARTSTSFGPSHLC